MQDQLHQNFFSIFDDKNTDKSAIADRIKNSVSTIGKWRSIGIPDGKRLACEMIVSENLSAKAAEMKAIIPLEITQEQFREWNQAALSESLLIEDWAVQALDRLAADEPLVADLPSTPVPLGLVADDPAAPPADQNPPAKDQKYQLQKFPKDQEGATPSSPPSEGDAQGESVTDSVARISAETPPPSSSAPPKHGDSA